MKKPLKKIILSSIDKELLDDIKETENYLVDEVNSLLIEYNLLDSAKDESNFCDYVVAPVQKVLGKKYRKDAKKIIENIKNISDEKIKELFENNSNMFCEKIELINGEDFNINIVQKNNSDDNIMTKAKSTYIVQIDTTVDKATTDAYFLRVFVTKIQNLRKESGLHPWNPINVHFHCDEENMNTLFISNIDFIKNKLKCEVSHDDIYGYEVLNVVTIDNVTVKCKIEQLDTTNQ
jgi:isoleucyl-tRNA synthetase